MTSQEYPFRPITLQNTLVDPPPSPDFKLQEYYRLMRMKKMLAQTQQKMENRINLFRKASQKIIKQREIEVKIFNKIEHAKQQPTQNTTPKNRQEVRTADSRPRRYPRHQRHEPQEKHQLQERQSMEARQLAQQLFLQRLTNARELKQQKSRFRTIIEQRRKLQLQRKLQSASSIRRTRDNAKLAKENLQRDRREQIRRELFEKCERERGEFREMERQLSSLQEEEQKALVLWKKTVESTF